MSVKRQVLVVVLVLSCVLYIQKQQDRKNDGFAIDKIQTSIPNSPEWNLPQIRQEDKAILNQPYYYLGRGLQFYAFASVDGNYVLKFMRHQRLEPNSFFKWLPGLPGLKTVKENHFALCKKRVGYIFRSLKIAMEDVPQETGLLYVHLNKGLNEFGVVTIYDKMNNPYQVDLDKTEFVLQKKALLIKPTIQMLMQRGDVEGACLRINQIFALLGDCAKKGVCDTDGALIRKNNLGFLPDRAIYVDTGKLARKESIKTKERFVQDLTRLQPLYEWLFERYPELATHFQQEQLAVIDAY